MEKYKYYSVLILGLFFFAGCDRNVTCPGFPDEFLSPINYSINDKLTYRDSAGSQIVFTVNEKFVQPKTEVHHDYYKNIVCDAAANFNSTSDSFRNGNNRFGISLSIADARHDSSEIIAEYNILGLNNKITVSPSIIIQYGSADSLVHNLTLGGKNYNNVIVTEYDTTLYPGKIIWKMYYEKNSGIIGFEDKQTHSLYYRE